MINFNMNIVLYSILAVVIFLIDVRSSLLHASSPADDSRKQQQQQEQMAWNSLKRQGSIMSNEVVDEDSGVRANLHQGKNYRVPGSEKMEVYECCPSFKEWIYPKGGVSRDGQILELFSQENVSQRFLQISCQPDRRGRPCDFLDQSPAFGKFSRCVQQYSYSYAIVRAYDSDPDAPYKVDHIRLRTGCKCVVSPTFGHYEMMNGQFPHRKPPYGIGYRTKVAGMRTGVSGDDGGGGGGGGSDGSDPVIQRRSSRRSNSIRRSETPSMKRMTSQSSANLDQGTSSSSQNRRSSSDSYPYWPIIQTKSPSKKQEKDHSFDPIDAYESDANGRFIFSKN